MTECCDFLIVGGGIVGLSIACAIRRQWPDHSVVVIEKEANSVRHASGRNSGVLHAGFYYSPESLKAKLTRDGNRLLRDFCVEEGVPVRSCGKVVVTTSAAQTQGLDELLRRGLANGVELHKVSPSELKQIEPMARTVDFALWSPNTGVANPEIVTAAIAKRAVQQGVVLKYGRALQGTVGKKANLGGEFIDYGHLVNCAGLYADRIARPLGFCDDYVVLPFTGIYRYAPKLKNQLRTHVYPVPDPRNPFLGVHATVTVDGDVKIGPTAIPSLSREAYRAIRDINGPELAQILKVFPRFLGSRHHNVLNLIRTEVPKYSTRVLVREARRLIPSLVTSDFSVKGRPGIRAQLFNVSERRLEMDFVVRGDEDSTHILNAVSPAWTSALSFADYVVEDMKGRFS